MNIIKSKYKSNYLNDCIKEGEKRVETNFLEKIKKKEESLSGVLTFVILILSLFCIILLLITKGGYSRTTALAFSSSSLVILIWVLLNLLESISGESVFYRHYRKKGRILSNPYDEDFQEFARLVEIGEQLQDLLSNDDNFVTVEDRYVVVCSAKEHKKVQSFDLDEYYGEDIVKENCLDFSVFDEDIDEYLKSSDKK